MQEQEHDLNLIAALVEGRLDDEERARVMDHLADCRECRVVFAELGRAASDGSLGREGSGQVSPHVGVPPVRRWRAIQGWLPIAASLAIAVVAIRLLVGVPENVGGPVPAPAPGAAAPADETELLLKRSGGRQVAGKVFRMTEGEWVDQDFDPAAARVIVDIRGRQERLDWLVRVPALIPYAELGERVLVVHEGTVYRIAP